MTDTTSDPQTETWQNVTKGRVQLRRYDRLTARDRVELIGSGRTFHVTPDDRRRNQDRVAQSDRDPFANGTLVPVRLIDTEEDARELASNPNVLSSSDIVDLFEAHWKTFDKRVQDITNMSALERMLEVASERDATVKQVAVIQARIRELNPLGEVGEAEQIETGGPRLDSPAGFNPVTPR